MRPVSEIKNRWRTIAFYTAGGAAVLVIFAGGVVIGARGILWSISPALATTVAPTPPPEGIDFSAAWTAWRIIDNRFVAQVKEEATTTSATATSTQASTTPNGATDPQERIWGMIEGMAASLDDPYTVFMPPAEAEIFQEDISGAFEGVGMEIAIRDNVLTVVSPLKDTPAYKAGIKAGDRVIEINGATTRNTSIEAAVKKIRGPRGTAVKFTIIREGADVPLKIEVMRDVINVPTIQTDARADGVFVIELLNFYAGSPRLFAQALQQYVDSGYGKLIIDVRGNPGGYLEAAVDIGSWFIPAGKPIVTEDYGENREAVVHRSRGYDVFKGRPPKVIILVDKGSASASEILAGALRHYGVGRMLGTATFGKGSVQELIPVTAETALKITVARWLGPDGIPIPHQGIEPDIKLEPREEDFKAGVDVQLEKAAEMLRLGQ